MNTFKLPYDAELFTGHKASAFKQFETNKFLYPEDYEILKHHFLIKKEDLVKLGWCETRFKVHEIAAVLSNEGYIPSKYTDKILRENYDDLLNEDLSPYQDNIIRFSAFHYIPPSGKRLILHFMPCAAENKWNFNILYSTINRMTNKNITREDIVYLMSRVDHPVRHPAFYRALFRQWFDVSGKRILDLCPDWGFKSLAILAEGGEYYCNTPHIKHFQEMANFLGGHADEPDEFQYDLAIINDVYPVQPNEVDGLLDQHRSLAENLIITVKADTVDDWRSLIAKYKPKRVVRVDNSRAGNPKDNNMLMIL